MSLSHPIDRQFVFDCILELMGDGELYEGDYSGRGMFGKKCVALTYESQSTAIGDMLLAMRYVASDNDANDEQIDCFLKAMRSHQFDNLGQSIVLYFPRLPLE